VFVGNKLGDCNCKGYLDGTSQSTEEIATYEVVHTVRSGSDYSANQGKGVADDEEPASSKDVRESANDQEADTETQGVGESNPGNVLGWPDRSINQCQRIRWQDPSQVV